MRKSSCRGGVAAVPPPSPAALPRPIGDDIGDARVCTSGASAPGPEQATLTRKWNTSQPAEAPCFTLVRPRQRHFYYRPFLYDNKVASRVGLSHGRTP